MSAERGFARSGWTRSGTSTGDYISTGDPLAGSAADDIWSMGIPARHFDGKTWNLVPSANLSLNATAEIADA